MRPAAAASSPGAGRTGSGAAPASGAGDWTSPQAASTHSASFIIRVIAARSYTARAGANSLIRWALPHAFPEMQVQAHRVAAALPSLGDGGRSRDPVAAP